jgi:hypothetical protein
MYLSLVNVRRPTVPPPLINDTNTIKQPNSAGWANSPFPSASIGDSHCENNTNNALLLLAI